MIAWWSSLELLEQVLACIAIPSTIILVVQTILILFSSFGGDLETEVDSDDVSDIPDGSGIQIFTVKGFVSFFCVFGWSSMLFLKLNLPSVVALLLGFALGVLCMFLMALAFAAFMKLQDSGNVEISNALGTNGTVYFKIPKSRSGLGKVSAVVCGRYGEFDAMTDEESDITTGTAVTVVAISSPNILIVTKK